MGHLRAGLALTPLLLCLCLPALGQEKKEKKEGNEDPQVKGEALSTLVDVFLLNGEKVRGVVKKGVYVELPNEIGFKPGDRKDPKAGIRLWHVVGSTSYAFILYKEVRSYRIVRTLSELEVREIASQARLEARKRAEEARAEARRKLESRRTAEEERELLEKLEKLADKEAEAEEMRKQALAHVEMLKLFPPGDGWLPTRIVEIRRRIASDLFPTPKEREFIKRFEEWKPAYQWWSKFGSERYGTLEKAEAELKQAAITLPKPVKEAAKGEEKTGTPEKVVPEKAKVEPEKKKAEEESKPPEKSGADGS